MTISFSVQLTDDLYLKASRLSYWVRIRSSTPFIIWLVIVLFALVLSLIGTVFFENQPSQQRPFVIVAAALTAWVAATAAIGLATYMLLPRQTKRLLLQQQLLSVPLRYEVTEQSLNIKSEYTETKLPYHMILKWAENRQVMLLYHTDITFSVIPKDATTNAAVDVIREQLITANRPGKVL